MVRVKGRRKAPSLRNSRRVDHRPPSEKFGTDAERTGGSHLFPQSETQSVLIRQARRLFALRGYDGVSVKEVADAAKLNISLVSYHFKGKEGLYRACLESFGRDSLDAVRRTLQTPKSFQECELRLAMFIDLMIDIFIKEPDASSMVFKECDMEALGIQDLFQSAFIEIFKAIIKFFEEAQSTGLINSQMDPHTISSIFFGALSHFARIDSISRRFFGRTIADAKVRESVADHLKKIFASSLEVKVNL